MNSDGSVMTTNVEIFGDARIASSIPSALADDVFWSSEGLKVSVKMKSGLAYHDKSSMEFDVVSSRSTVHMLRDHGRLITAVLADWGWRPNIKRFTDQINDALYFVPSCVEFNLTLVNGFKLGLILNDENVVDDFADSKSNTILWLRANTLAVKTCTRNDTFQPAFGCTQYSARPGRQRLVARKTIDQYRYACAGAVSGLPHCRRHEREWQLHGLAPEQYHGCAS